jgi:methionyl-tRNA synthetase
LLFAKIEDTEVQAQIDKLNQSKAQNEQDSATLAPAKDDVSFEQFGAMDIRVATILAAEKVEKTKKLLKLTLDTGIDQRTVVSGIAEFYKPEDIVGQQVCVLANLQPRLLKGIESQGMILMAEDAQGKLCFVQPSQLISNGATVR